MFNFFKSRQEHVEELMEAIKESSHTVTPLEVPTPEKKPSKDFYRVGWSEADEMVTLTIAPEHGYSTTLALTPDECERMIRMLRAAYPLDETDKDVV